MIGYIVVTNIDDDWSPLIGVKFDSHVHVITQFYYRPGGCYNIYKVEFRPTGSMKRSGWGEGYTAAEYTVLELV